MADRARAGSWVISGSTGRTKVCGLIAWGKVMCDVSWVLWYMVMVAGPKPYGAVAEPTGAWRCFGFCSWVDSWQVSLLGIGLLSQHDPPWSWTPLVFHNFQPQSQSSHKGTFVCEWLPSYCSWVRIQAGDFLFCHLAGITVLSIIENWVLRSLTLIAESSIFPCNSSSFCFVILCFVVQYIC